MDIEDIIKKLQIFVSCIDNIRNSARSDEELKKIKVYEKKIKELIPNSICIKDKDKIRRIMNIFNTSSENLFIYYGERLGLDLLNSLMYLHGIFQINPVRAAYLQLLYQIESENMLERDLVEFRRIHRLISKFDYILLSAIEFLLKKCSSNIINKRVDLSGRKKDFINYVKIFFEQFEFYITHKHQLSLFEFEKTKKINLILGPGRATHFILEYESEEHVNFSEKAWNIELSYDIKDDRPEFEELIQDFNYVNEFWIKEKGYQIAATRNIEFT